MGKTVYRIQLLHDQILLKSYLSGDEAAFEILIRKHKDKVFAFILSKIKNYNLAHDLFQ